MYVMIVTNCTEPGEVDCKVKEVTCRMSVTHYIVVILQYINGVDKGGGAREAEAPPVFEIYPI